MKIFLFTFLFICCTEQLVLGAAAQAIQQQKRTEQAIIEQAVIEKQLTDLAIQQKIMAEQEMVIEQNIPIEATITLPQEETGEQTTVDMSDILKSLETSSKAWPLIIGREPKTFIVLKYIDYFKKKGILIKKPADDYVSLLDDLMAQEIEIQNNPFESVLQLVAVLEYDFDNGQDKDKMLIKLLGKDGYLKNKKRLGLP